MRLKHFSVLALSLFTALSAHAKVTWQTSKANDWQKPELSDNTAGLVFIRADQDAGYDSSTNISINNRFLTSLNDGHYTTDVACAGSVQISVAPTKAFTNDLSANAINVALLPGYVQYVYIEVDEQYRPTLRAINEQDALPLLAQSSRQTHQISRTSAENCPTFLPPPPAPVVAPVSTYTPPVVSIQPKKLDNPSIHLNIHFDHNKSVIKPSYRSELSRAAKFLSNYPTMDATVEGHTDSNGDATYNQMLSQRRAEAVRKALILGYGIDPNRLYAKGYGESRPIADNKTAEGRAQNRRVVISVPAEKE